MNNIPICPRKREKQIFRTEIEVMIIVCTFEGKKDTSAEHQLMIWHGMTNYCYSTKVKGNLFREIWNLRISMSGDRGENVMQFMGTTLTPAINFLSVILVGFVWYSVANVNTFGNTIKDLYGNCSIYMIAYNIKECRCYDDKLPLIILIYLSSCGPTM